MDGNWLKHSGGCHCGKVRFEVLAPTEIEASECNCSICSKTGFLDLIVPKSQFSLLHGSEFLTAYTFNTGVAQHLFCKVCGIKSFYVPRSNPDGYSVNVCCLDPQTIQQLTIKPFDGQNWERHAGGVGEAFARVIALSRHGFHLVFSPAGLIAPKCVI